jgi:NADPH-dependent curcumin reductase
MTALPSREIHLVARPVGVPEAAHFAVAENPAPAPGAGEVQVKNLL